MEKWRLMQTLFLLFHTSKGSGLSYDPPAVIESALDGDKSLDFHVGSTVVLTCSIADKFKHVWYNASGLSMCWRSAENNTSSCNDVDVTIIGDHVIRTTLHNVTKGKRLFYCNHVINGTLGSATVRIGYPPSDKFNITCQLFPQADDLLQCCVQTDMDALNSNPVPVEWKIDMKFFPDIEQFEKFPCLDLEDPKLQEHSNFSVRVTASNALGSTAASITFRPVEEINPGPVENLLAHNLTNPEALLVTWSRPEGLYLSRCFGMNGLYYDVIVQPLPAHLAPSVTMIITDNCDSNGTLNYTVEGLVPFTRYNITVVARSRHHHGKPQSKQQTTSQSKPKTAPSIVAWAHSSTINNSLKVYLKKYAHEEKGGDIVCYDVCLVPDCAWKSISNSERVTLETTNFSRCDQGCIVKVRANTIKGSSPVAQVRIPPPSKDDTRGLKMYVEKGINNTHTVFWEVSNNVTDNVTSVYWCYGAPSAGFPSLIDCQTELRRKDVRKSSRHQNSLAVPEIELLRGEELTGLCKERRYCDWYFALGIGPTPEGSVPSLSWVLCRFHEDGDAPTPELAVDMHRLIGQLLWQCKDDKYTNTGRPIAAQVSYSLSENDACSQGNVINATEEMASGRTFTLNNLDPGRNYTVCARLRSNKGWGEWKQMQVFTAVRITDHSSLTDHGKMTAMAVGLAVFGLILLIICVCLLHRRLSRQYTRFTRSAETPIKKPNKKWKPSNFDSVKYTPQKNETNAKPYEIPFLTDVTAQDPDEKQADSAFSTDSSSTSSHAKIATPDTAGISPDNKTLFGVNEVSFYCVTESLKDVTNNPVDVQGIPSRTVCGCSPQTDPLGEYATEPHRESDIAAPSGRTIVAANGTGTSGCYVDAHAPLLMTLPTLCKTVQNQEQHAYKPPEAEYTKICGPQQQVTETLSLGQYPTQDQQKSETHSVKEEEAEHSSAQKQLKPETHSVKEVEAEKEEQEQLQEVEAEHSPQQMQQNAETHGLKEEGSEKDLQREILRKGSFMRNSYLKTTYRSLPNTD